MNHLSTVIKTFSSTILCQHPSTTVYMILMKQKRNQCEFLLLLNKVVLPSQNVKYKQLCLLISFCPSKSTLIKLKHWSMKLCFLFFLFLFAHAIFSLGWPHRFQSLRRYWSENFSTSYQGTSSLCEATLIMVYHFARSNILLQQLNNWVLFKHKNILCFLQNGERSKTYYANLYNEESLPWIQGYHSSTVVCCFNC